MSLTVYSLDDTPDERGGPDMGRAAQSAQNRFGWKLMERLMAENPRQNVVISPLSVWNCGVWLQNGACGATKAGLRRAFELQTLTPTFETDDSAPDAEWNASAKNLSAALQSQSSAEIRIANGLWSDIGFEFDADFEAISREFFGATPAVLDFAQRAHAADVVNNWVARQTNQEIPAIVGPQHFHVGAAVLANAIYFKALWENAFDPELTKTASFHAASGDVQSVPMMRADDLTGAYFEGAGYQAARLPYRNNECALWALHPDAGKTPLDALKSWSQEVPNRRLGVKLKLQIPRLKLSFSHDLTKDLRALGAREAFGAGADFSRLGHPALFVNTVLHETRLEVDEKGTVAAAATVVIMTLSAPSPSRVVELIFDRPFALIVCDATNRTPLFTGIINTFSPA